MAHQPFKLFLVYCLLLIAFWILLCDIYSIMFTPFHHAPPSRGKSHSPREFNTPSFTASEPDPKDTPHFSKLISKYWKMRRGNMKTLDPDDKLFMMKFLEKKSLWANLKYHQVGGGIKAYALEDRSVSQTLWQNIGKLLYSEKFNKNTTKKILLRESLSWWHYEGEKYLSCPGSFNQQCQLVDQNYTQNIDAILFVQDHFHPSVPIFPSNVFRIFHVLESPYSSPRFAMEGKNDILASYWRGSDIQTPYSKWIYYDPVVRRKIQNYNFAHRKSKMVAIFMSNCGGTNNRMGYVNMLASQIQVDIYGKCGSFVCNKYDQEYCFKKLKKDYRFYLAFENSNCRDYITEKFFINALQNDLIPVVLGAHPVDYAAIAPENSYIHVEDFSGPAELATYLKELAANEVAYNKYFEWKGTGEFISTDLFCRVCSLLFYADIHPRRRRRSSFYWEPKFRSKKNPMCLARGRWYWNRTKNEDKRKRIPSFLTTSSRPKPTKSK